MNIFWLILIIGVIEEVKNLICEKVLMNMSQFSCQKLN